MPTLTPTPGHRTSFSTEGIIGTVLGVVGLILALVPLLFSYKRSHETGRRELRWRCGSRQLVGGARETDANVQLVGGARETNANIHIELNNGGSVYYTHN